MFLKIVTLAEGVSAGLFLAVEPVLSDFLYLDYRCNGARLVTFSARTSYCFG